MNKQKIHQTLLEVIDEKVSVSQRAVDSSKDAKLSETKSSAGDKFETGRAMMQREQEMNEQKLLQNLLLKKKLQQINLNTDFEKVENGSLVLTTKGLFYISIGMGKMKIDEETIFAISIEAPIGQKMIGLKAGESFSFNGNEIAILEVT